PDDVFVPVNFHPRASGGRRRGLPLGRRPIGCARRGRWFHLRPVVHEAISLPCFRELREPVPFTSPAPSMAAAVSAAPAPPLPHPGPPPPGPPLPSPRRR